MTTNEQGRGPLAQKGLMGMQRHGKQQEKNRRATVKLKLNKITCQIRLSHVLSPLVDGVERTEITVALMILKALQSVVVNQLLLLLFRKGRRGTISGLEVRKISEGDSMLEKRARSSTTGLSRRARPGGRLGGTKAVPQLETRYLAGALATFAGSIAADTLYAGPCCVRASCACVRPKRK